MSDRIPAAETLLLTVPQVAKRLQIARGRAYELVATGQLPVVKIGHSLRVPVAALHRWIEAATQQGSATNYEPQLEPTNGFRIRR